MPRHFLLLILSLVIISYPYSQEQHQSPEYFSVYKTAEKFYNSARPTTTTDSLALQSYVKTILLLQGKKINDSILFDSYLKAGILQMTAKKDQQALDLFLGSIRTAQSSSLPDSIVFKSYLFAGNSYYNLNNLDSASYCYKKAEDLINIHPSLAESERLYNKSGALYYQTGDYKKSIQYFTKALSVVEKNPSANPYFIVNYKNNIASAMRKLGDYAHAMELYKSLLPYNINKNELLHNIGVTYLNEKNAAEAIHYLNQVSYSNQVKYNDIGEAYLQMRKYDSADYYLNAAVDAYKKTGSRQKNLDYAITLKYMGDVWMGKNNSQKAAEYYQQAIIQADPDFNEPGIEKNPQSFQGLHNSFFLFDALTAKAIALHSLALRNDTTFYIHAFAAYSSAIKLSRQVEKTFNSDEAKLFLVNNVNAAYKDAIDLAIQLYDLTKNKFYLLKAFDYSENSKASVLLASLRELSLESVPGLPQTLIRDERNLKALIAKLSIQSAEAADSSLSNEIQNKITDLEIKLSGLQQKLDENPAYHQLKFDSRDISMDTVQEKIVTDDATLLSFYWLKNKLICFYITKEDDGYTSIDLNDLQKNILSLQQMLNVEDAHDNRKITDLSTKLFQQLIAPVFEKIKDKKRLLIIPHNEISYIPFEILTDPKTNEILLKNFSISYNYSANFFTPGEKTLNETYDALAMAPFASASSKELLPVLSASRKEIESLKGKILFDSAATKQNFLQFSPDYPVIHLATHAVANDVDPLRSFVEFYGLNGDADTVHRLYEQEIYHLDMKSARLVILSACETGAGHLINGEGIMSLSRAFSYAGCKSVIASLWKADDDATAFISRQLHIYLQQGLRKDKALQKAKLDYLDNDKIDAGRKIPAYWAHLVLIGNAQAIEKKSSGYIWIALIVLILFVIEWRIGRWKAKN
ncbi:MAG: CHAT domain-containing protein [Bacteroidetes bacterium]|nr:CHAT domain-containing protein [Bacteroidota bacterium]